MKRIHTNLRACLQHTRRYYGQFFTPRNLSAIALASAAVTVSAVGLNAVVAKADVAKWMAEDVFNEEIFDGKYDYIRNEDAPEESEYRFHLQMPMMLEGYLDSSNYVSNGTSDPAHPKLDESLEMTTQPDFFHAEDFELPSDEEWEESAGDATEFVEDRPPKSGLE